MWPALTASRSRSTERSGQWVALRWELVAEVRFDQVTGGRFRHVADGDAIKAEEGAVHQLEFPPEEPLRAELAAFVDSIEKRTPPFADGWAGFNAVRSVEAALESVRTGAWIDIGG